ncbi:hypothetical protein CHLRE_06g278209v5 [Chlamydomonas reinhardtii]|uniref:SCP domain-containing protein n=1 Tax=Chlamydomonas reinhardtii TaxID=3055 RepID=A0A2K3DP59_CHLRE|nr:uncharacterized protein CHLRE_06g278209v5 [Chlamydomonas reinhardtii]PNW82319.1 hypothetical protein CHLRE_06g278209v5 [Chlamydomonas reinhardtii]
MLRGAVQTCVLVLVLVLVCVSALGEVEWRGDQEEHTHQHRHLLQKKVKAKKPPSPPPSPPATGGGGKAVRNKKSPPPAPSPSPSPPSPGPPAPVPTGGSGVTLDGSGCPDAQAALDLHNSYRAAHGGVPALQWDAALAADAQAYAEVLAGLGCTLIHATQPPGFSATRFGENLYMSAGYPRTPLTCAPGITSWYNEVSYYKFTSTPYTDSYSTGRVVGHFTQIVWRATSRLGCGMASASYSFPGFPAPGQCKVVVCRYRQAGNVVGDSNYFQNVLPKA